MRNITLLTFCIFISLYTVIAQEEDWRTMMLDHNNNFYDIQDKFNEEYGTDSPTYKDGAGWKQYKRWEYYYQYRVDKDGNFPDPSELRALARKYRPQDNTVLRTPQSNSGSWEVVGPINKPLQNTYQTNGNGRLSCIAFHPTDPNIIFVGSPGAGVWKSTDSGNSWTQLINGLTRLGVNSIAINPDNPEIMYIGTGDRDGGDAVPQGVWKSTDGGLSWDVADTRFANRNVTELLMHPENPDILIASTSLTLQYRTEDGGLSWQYTNLGDNSGLKDIAFHPTNPNIVYGASKRFYKSTDNGKTYTKITNGIPTNVNRIAIAVSKDKPDYVYLVAGNNNGLVGIYKSTDAGNNFTQVADSPNLLGYAQDGNDNNSQSWYDLVIAADPEDADKLYVGGINLWRSIDGGKSWKISSHWVRGVHADQHAFAFHPTTNNLYNGNDGGLYMTSDHGNSWQEFSNGLGIAQVYKIGVSQTEKGLVINGYQDNGTAIVENGIFRTELGGDGMECIIDPSDENYMYGSIYYGSISRSSNKGNNFEGINGNINESGAWVTPYILDPNNTDLMYIGMKNIWRNDDVKRSYTWRRLSNFSDNSNMIDITVAPSNSSILYFSKDDYDTRLQRTHNAEDPNPTWTNLSNTLPSEVYRVLDIVIDPNDETHIFIVTTNRFIYESTDSGNTWTSFNQGLSSLHKNCLVIDPTSPVNGMYVGTDLGVHYRDNTMREWEFFSEGLPPLEVTELEIYMDPEGCDNRLYAATYGMGLFVSDLKDQSKAAPISCFTVSSTETCSGNIIKFKNTSKNLPSSYIWDITPSTISYENGTSATSAEPEIKFQEAGEYTVTLITSNEYGEHIVTKDAFISIGNSEDAVMYSENFDALESCSETFNCRQSKCSITSRWFNLKNGIEDDIDFRIHNGPSPQEATGPQMDYTTKTEDGKYLLVESGSCAQSTAILQSGCIFLDEEYDFEFAYHMYGNTQGNLTVDIHTTDGWLEEVIKPIAGDRDDKWHLATIDLSQYAQSSVKVRIRYTTGDAFFSDFGIDGLRFISQNALPFSLLKFDANVVDERVRITWATANEELVDHYIVQRSKNGMDWEDLSQTEAIRDGQPEQNYTEWDDNPIKYISYYRLKSISLDGSYSYSEKVKVYFHNKSLFLYPNPATDQITLLKTDIDQDEILIQNLQGQEQKFEITSISEHKAVLNISSIPNGFYFVVLRNGKDLIDARRVFVH